MITAYREPDRVKGRSLMVKLIKSLSSCVPGVLKEVLCVSVSADAGVFAGDDGVWLGWI